MLQLTVLLGTGELLGLQSRWLRDQQLMLQLTVQLGLGELPFRLSRWLRCQPVQETMVRAVLGECPYRLCHRFLDRLLTR